MKLLIVEDDAGIQCLLSTLFTDEGFLVNAAGDGQAALDLLQREGAGLSSWTCFCLG